MAPPLEFSPTPLFGGALTTSIPTTFTDVSTIRQIPDNQEVFLSSTGFTSVTIDLCERVESPPPHPNAPPASSPSTTASSSTSVTNAGSSANSSGVGGNASATAADHHALTYHFFDIVAAEDTKRIYSTNSNINLRHFPTTTPVASLLAITTPPPSAKGRATNEAKWVGVMMTLIRLVKAQTDLLVVVNVPCVDGDGGDGDEGEVVDFEGGVFGRRMEEGKGVMEGVVGGLRVVDWGLFGDEGGSG